jgi:glycosyltransferase involved in cell wall biosynthesis
MIDPRRPEFSNTPVSPKRPRSWYSRAASLPNPIVSIVTPFHSGAPFLDETAASVLGQSLQHFEWILVDDAAPGDEARAALDRWRDRDPRIRVIEHAESRGPGASRNAGVRAARAEFVFLLDDDDLLEPTAIEKTLWFLLAHPEFGFANGWSVGFGGQQYLWPMGFERAAGFLDENCAPTFVLVRKECWDAAGGNEEQLIHGFEDWDFWLRCARAGHWGGSIPEYLAWYRRRAHHGDRWSNWADDERVDAFRKRLHECYGDLSERFPQLAQADPRPRPVLDELPFANLLGAAQQRLLFIVPWLTMGGADKFNLDLVEGLTARGYEITIATTLPGDSSWAPEFARFTSDIFVLPNFLDLSDQPRFLRYLIESRRPDTVLLSNSELGYQLLPYLRDRCPVPAYLDYCHMEEEHWRDGGYPRRSVSMRGVLDRSLVSSQHLKRWMVERGGDAERIEVIYTNIDAERWKPRPESRERLRKELGFDMDVPVVLFAGRLCDQKKPLVFARVLERLAARGVPFRAVVAGDGELRPALERFLCEHALDDRVLLLGAVPTDEMPALLSVCDVFFLPSRWEGIALSIFEAMAQGRVVVGADVGGQRELLTPECGFLLPFAEGEAEVAAYTDVLARVLCDAPLLARLGKAARERIEQSFALSDMIERMARAFEVAREPANRAAPTRLDGGLAVEWAAQAVEQTRLQRLAETLWLERSRLQATSSPTTVSAAVDPHLAALEVAAIEASRAWRTVARLKRNPVYRSWARLRYGRDWDAADSRDEAIVRLARIRASRSYRVLQALKRTWLYRRYAARRYSTSS